MTKTKKKKIIGLSCGRKNGNSEILLKEACMGAEELGAETEIIRAMELRVKPCTGCESCFITLSKGGKAKCAVEDDDVAWILEKTVVEDCGLIVSVPVYHLTVSGNFKIINDRMLATVFNHPEVLKKTRVGAIICVGGGWTTPLGLSMANIFVQHTRILVDQIQVNGGGSLGAVLLNKRALRRAKKLGENVVKAMGMPIREVSFMGHETDISCPVCHCNLLQVPKNLPHVICPVCNVRGALSFGEAKMKVEWNEWDIKHPRLSEYGISKHTDHIGKMVTKFFKEDQGKIKELKKVYSSYGKIIRP